MSLDAQLSKFADIENAKVLEVLKDGEICRTEKVLYHGQMCVRKIYKDASFTSSFDNPNLEPCVLHEAGVHLQGVIASAEIKGKTYSILEYIEGAPLQAKVDVLQNFNDIAEALIYLHKNHIIHRDVKPSNIIVNTQGAWLIDLGIAREASADKTQDTILMGTRSYAPPEQFGYGQTSERSDVYALGMTLYWMLTGKTSSKPLVARDIKDECGKVAEAIAKATSFDPNERFATVSEFKDALNRPSKVNLSPFASKAWNFVVIAAWLMIVFASIWAIVNPDPINGYNIFQRAFEFIVIAIVPSTIFGYCLLYKKYLPNLKSFSVQKTLLICAATVAIAVFLIVLALLLGFM